MSIRMLPMPTVSSRFPCIVRDLSQKLGKSLIERISDLLSHLVRNSVDHGVETPDVRMASGKPAEGTNMLKASHQGGNLLIEVGDDGAGASQDSSKKIVDIIGVIDEITFQANRVVALRWW